MKTKYLIALALLIVVLGNAEKSFAQQAASENDEWTFLGNRRADYTLDRDILSISEGNEHITALKFIITQGTLTMHSCTVHFTDGDTKELVFVDGVNYMSNGITMHLPDNSKIVDKVTFWYDTQDNSDKKSIVEVWASNL